MYHLERILANISDEEAFVLVIFGIYVIGFLLFLISMLIRHILLAFPLYIMAEKAGYNYPFLAFVPFANYYVAHILPIKEYSYLGMFNTYDRYKGFWLYICLKYVIRIVVSIALSVFSIIPIISILLSLFGYAVNLILIFAGGAAKAIMISDLLMTYDKNNKGLAIALGVLSVFIPLVFPISCMVYCRKEPVFGFGNFYVPQNIQNYYE